MLTLDYFILDRLVAELSPQISGASIAKIHQPGNDSLVFKLWNGRENLRLLIQVRQGARIHLTSQEYPNPFQPPRFCQLLRSRLKRLQSLEMAGYDRSVVLNFAGIDQSYRLVCELHGTHSNLYLLDGAGLLLDALNRPPPFADRELRRGERYRPLPPLSRSSLADRELTPPADITNSDLFESWLLQQVAPMSKIQAFALKKAVELGASIPSVFKQFQADWMSRQSRPALIEYATGSQLVAYPPEGLQPLKAPEAGLSQLIDDAFVPAAEVKAEIGDRARFRLIINGQLSRLHKRQKNIAVQQEKTESFDDRRYLGNLLLSHLHLVKKGMTEVEVIDWATEPRTKIMIELQEKLSPQENAEHLFRRYKKEKRGVAHVDRRQQETLDEIQWLESLLLALDEAVEKTDIAEIGQELLTAGLIRPKKGEPSGRNRSVGVPAMSQTLSPGGLRIFWGRNNRSNDHLSARMTDRDDLWFHAHNMPGCHLVLKRDGRCADFPAEDILYAARIAAGYSRGKDAARIEVIVTEGRHVSRPKGARPGLVTVAEYRTVMAEPLRLSAEQNQQ